jgi:hypothetical protein
MVKQITDHGLAMVLLLGLMTVSPAQAQKVGGCTVITGAGEQVSVLVNHRQVTGEELRLYLDTSGQIDAAFGKAGSGFDARILTTLLNNVDALPGSVDESSKSCLRIHIESKVEAVVVPGDHLISDLLSSDDPSRAHLGVEVLLNQDTKAWFVDRKLPRLLKAKLASNATDSDLRVDVMYLFGYAGAFQKVKRIALNLAADQVNPALARRAAEVICWNMVMNKQFSDLGDLFRSSSGILRQQAALALLWEDNSALAADLKPDLTEEVVRMIRNNEIPPETRGDAIEASARLLDSDTIVSTLVDMLEPQNWFFGATGMHEPEHSLVPVIKVLAQVNRPDIHDRLRALRKRLSELNDHDRQFVERALQRLPD